MVDGVEVKVKKDDHGREEDLEVKKGSRKRIPSDKVIVIKISIR